MRILYTLPSGQTGEFATDSPTALVGRQLGPGPNLLEIKDSKISSCHARLSREADGLWIEDLGSTNGTWVDRRKIKAKTRAKLSLDSIVLLGQTVLQLAPEEDAARPADPAAASCPGPAGTVPAPEPLPDAAPPASAAPSPEKSHKLGGKRAPKLKPEKHGRREKAKEAAATTSVKPGARGEAASEAGRHKPAGGAAATPPAGTAPERLFQGESASGVAPAHQTPAEIVEACRPLSEIVLAGASLESTRRRLSAVFGLCASLEGAAGPEALAPIVLDRLLDAFPDIARGGHCGLLLGPNLVLKAFRPDDQPPSCSLTLARRVLANGQACLWRMGGPGSGDASRSLIDTGVQSAMYAPLVWTGEMMGVLYLDAVSPAGVFDLDDLRLLQVLASQAAMFLKIQGLQASVQREAMLKSRLFAQFPARIAERMALHPDRLGIVSEHVEAVTVLFSDVRGFTRLSAGMAPESVVRMLNDMFHDLTPIVLRNGGTVDKYVGDAVLAVFGSPDPDPGQWAHAVRAALEMQAAIRSLVEGRWRTGSPFRIGIGIHTGPAIHGFIGAPERMEYTVIGETVNRAARYCSGAAAGEILISPETYARLHHLVEVAHPARTVETKHEDALKAYLVRGWKNSPPG